MPTFVFDEVDAGVGGKAAVEVGRRLALLARHAQVLVVTHLPQVAAFADRHVVVVKSSDGTVTTSGLTTLDDEGRVRELSRMLAGLEDSDTALAHAEELLATAQQSRAGPPDAATRRRPCVAPTRAAFAPTAVIVARRLGGGRACVRADSAGHPPGNARGPVSGLSSHEIPLASTVRRRPARSDRNRPDGPADQRPAPPPAAR